MIADTSARALALHIRRKTRSEINLHKFISSGVTQSLSAPLINYTGVSDSDLIRASVCGQKIWDDGGFSMSAVKGAVEKITCKFSIVEKICDGFRGFRWIPESDPRKFSGIKKKGDDEVVP